MLILNDGPCAGTYMCKRAPDYLRAVINGKGEKDVLDLPGDTPEPDEEIYIYRLVEGPGWIHLKRGGKKGSGYFATGSYKYIPGIDTGDLRDNIKWIEWIQSQGVREK